MIRALYLNGRLQALMITLLLVTGLAAISQLPRTEDPRITSRFASVITYLPGASAARVEAQVSEKIEQKLKRQSEIKTLTSTSRPGISVVQVELKDEVMETAQIWSRIRDLIGDVRSELPTSASAPTLDDEAGYAFTRILALTARDNALSLSMLGRYAKELQSQLRNVSGTELVKLFGQPEEEVLVAIDSHKAFQAGLTPQQILQSIKAADAKVSAGELVNAHNRIQLEVKGAFTELERIQRIPLNSLETGQQYTLGQVADIRRQEKMPAAELALINGKPGILIGTRMLPDVRIDKWTARVDAQLAVFNQRLPLDIAFSDLFNQNTYTQTRLGDLVGNVLLGFVIITSVLLVTLGWRAALVVSLALPLTVLFTLTTMMFYGLPIHQMSVTGLVVALGIMVDNAIVITDAIQRLKAEGKSALEACVRAVKHFWLPLAGSTLTTILAFAPIVIMPGPAGEFVGGIALSVIFSLVGSYLISHSLVAVIAARFVKPEQSESWLDQGVRLNRLSQVFRASLYASLAHPKKTLALVICLPLLGFWGAGQLTEQFFPPSDRDMFQLELHFSPATSLQGTQARMSQVDEYLRGIDGINSIAWVSGNNAPMFYYNLVGRQRGSANYAQAMITTRDFDTANRLIPELQQDLDARFSDIQVLVRKLEQGPPFNAPIEIRLYGPNLDILSELGQEVRGMLSQLPDVIHTRPTLLAGAPKLWLDVEEDKLAHTGLTLSALASQLDSQYRGNTGGSLLEQTETVHVRVRVDDEARTSSLELLSGEVQGIARSPLLALATPELKPSRGAIPRRNGERVNVVEGFIAANVLPQTVLDQFSALVAESDFHLPAGYHMEIGGESAKRDEAVGKLLGSVGIIVTLLVSVLVLSFNSFRLTGLITINAIQAAGLGLLSLYLADYPFGFQPIIALLGLMGLAINSAIVIIAELQSEQALDDDSIVAGVMASSRHISSTTITTVGGFLPLIMAGGGFWPPFAITIAGGTALTSLLSFYFVPVAYRLLYRSNKPSQTALLHHH